MRGKGIRSEIQVPLKQPEFDLLKGPLTFYCKNPVQRARSFACRRGGAKHALVGQFIE